MIIDIHTHTFPDAIAQKAVEKLAATSHSKAFLDGTQADLSASMKRAGIDYSVVLPVATDPQKVGKMTEDLLLLIIPML